MQKTQNLQDQFLNQLRKDRAVVTMRGFDGFTVVLDSDGRQQLIYKHAISTVVPPRPIPFDGED